ncbi:MAG: hypothetical protein J5I62_05600 [Flavobacteriales bacterium]|nr:hypothetical protein [Flavobacteriales bacterium]MEB2342169.1 hypothetical protein [Flavobacteriia bacterium]
MQVGQRSDLAQRLIAMRGHGLDEVRNGPHALRRIAEVAGVEYIDDSGSTFLDAALLSLVDVGGPLVWIASAPVIGAVDGHLKDFLKDHVEAIVFYGEADQRQVDALHAELGQVYNADTLRTAVFAARELARQGSKVLFSPACPCGTEAANHAERAQRFKLAVADL